MSASLVTTQSETTLETVVLMDPTSSPVPQGTALFLGYTLSLEPHNIHAFMNYSFLSFSDVMCGQLFCEQGTYQNRVNSVYIIEVGVYIPSTSGVRQCM